MTFSSPDPGMLTFVIGVQAAALVVWGASLTQRVKRLEEDMKPLKEMPEKLARIQERQDSLLDQFKDLNASIRWMRSPAPTRSQQSK